MGVWSDRVVPRLVDRAGSAPEVVALRRDVCAGLHGRVLEVGFGSGLNLAHYPAAVASVHAVEPSDVGWALSERRRRRSPVPVVRSGLDGERLDEPDAAFDCVLSTLTLCTIPDVAAALAEVRRVLVPGGRLHFLEHGLAPDARVVAWQHRLDALQGRLFAGCHLDRDIPALVRGAGLEIEHLEARYLGGPAVSRPWTFGYLGRAVRVGGA
jgi:SAM-dependent methyltransferase